MGKPRTALIHILFFRSCALYELGAEALALSRQRLRRDPEALPRRRGQIAYETGAPHRDMVWEDLKPSDILTRKAFDETRIAG